VNHTVLIVDDSEFVRDAIGEALCAQGGMSVVWARNGKEALGTLERMPEIDAVVLDVNMPILDGEGMLRSLSTRRAHSLFVIAIGTAAEAQGLQACLALGAKEVLRKPLDMNVLCDLLREGLRRRDV
jgi:CheY-like chemotaxis protein